MAGGAALAARNYDGRALQKAVILMYAQSNHENQILSLVIYIDPVSFVQ